MITASRISIKPFIANVPKGGLEKYGMSIHDGVTQRDDLGFIEKNGIKRYFTGLDEFAPEVQALSKDEKEAVIKDIRRTILRLENELNSNYDVTAENLEDKDFWSKVTMFKSQGPVKKDNIGKPIPTYWDTVTLTLTDTDKFLNPNDLHDVILINAIQAGGFALVAKSLETALVNPDKYNFYLDKSQETAAIETEVMKLRNKAGAELEKMFNKDTNRLFYVTKMIANNSMNYDRGTPNDILYRDCGLYINGETVNKNKKVTASKFLEYGKMEMDEIKMRTYVKDATALRFISMKGDGHLYYIKTGTLVGKTPADVVMFLKNPLNEEIYKEVERFVEAEWKK